MKSNNLSLKERTRKTILEIYKTFFIEKYETSGSIILSEKNLTVSEYKKIFDTYFTNVTKGLKQRQADKCQSSEKKKNTIY